ncbi:carbon storage regulator CsrA [Paenibacillus hexagrammi]|uniref:Translational regulator CsrA n=1 Tax=Paenibacillus hexagrammi TaxID=2908839 RepID=A0ABY3SIM0_9BACL|nr:carbon storage regulator CsrA [Paenibacillus sp. YPD9-1]UJF33225.1 carbon storage regulator CsrA [Paenibacillus sp. YPD9-1]
MLVLTRKKGEAIMIGDQIELVILGIEGDTIKVGIQAPKQVGIYRKEVYLSIKQSNEEASSSSVNLKNLAKLLNIPK